MGITERTLYNYMHDEVFQKEYQEKIEEIIKDSDAKTKEAGLKAINHLISVIEDQELDAITKIKADAYSIVASDIYQSIGNILKNSSTSNSTDVSFNFTYVVPDSNKVLKPTLSSSYWNPNHIYNQYTISYIDFEHSSIKVSPYSIK